MRTSLREIQQIENYLSGKMEYPLVFQAKLIIDPILKMNLELQKKIHLLVRMYSRKKLKSELEGIHQCLLSDPAKKEFRKKIKQIFND